MKITDYGLWFRPIGGIDYSKNPQRDCEIHFNGFNIGGDGLGYYVHDYVFSIDITCLADIGFRINPNSPGEIVHGAHDWWEFPEDYVPSEFDLKERITRKRKGTKLP